MHYSYYLVLMLKCIVKSYLELPLSASMWCPLIDWLGVRFLHCHMHCSSGVKGLGVKLFPRYNAHMQHLCQIYFEIFIIGISSKWCHHFQSFGYIRQTHFPSERVAKGDKGGKTALNLRVARHRVWSNKNKMMQQRLYHRLVCRDPFLA